MASTLKPSRLSERLATHPHASRHRRHTATILALRAEIQTELNNGWSRHAIWSALFQDQRIHIRYHAFLRYLRRTGIVGPEQAPIVAPVAAKARAAAGSLDAGFVPSRRLTDEDLY
jgi:hypothetical protein